MLTSNLAQEPLIGTEDVTTPLASNAPGRVRLSSPLEGDPGTEQIEGVEVGLPATTGPKHPLKHLEGRSALLVESNDFAVEGINLSYRAAKRHAIFASRPAKIARVTE